MPQVGIIVGSATDQPVMEDTLKTLTDLGVEAELIVASAHRNPKKVQEYVENAPGTGVEVFVAAAGGAAALPGVVASHTTLPVIGVPIASSELGGRRRPLLHRADAPRHTGRNGGRRGVGGAQRGPARGGGSGHQVC